METQDIQLLRELFHPAIFDIIDSSDGVEDAVNSLQYLRDEIQRAIDILENSQS